MTCDLIYLTFMTGFGVSATYGLPDAGLASSGDAQAVCYTKGKEVVDRKEAYVGLRPLAMSNGVSRERI